MTKKLLNIALGTMLAVSLCHAQEDSGIESAANVSESAVDTFDLLLGGGFVISSGYQDYIDDVYDNSGYSDSGGYGWLALYVGGEFRPDPQFGIIGGCDLWLNGVDVTGGPLDENYANIILIPSVYGQFYFTESRTVYINGGLNLPLPVTGSDYFEFENNGIGLGANIGVELAETFRIEAGYTHVPVKAKATASNPVLSGEEEYNFGGLQIRMLLAF